jgi:hypothetical protein
MFSQDCAVHQVSTPGRRSAASEHLFTTCTHQIVIDALGGDEIRVRPILSNGPLANHYEAISVLHRALPNNAPHPVVTT